MSELAYSLAPIIAVQLLALVAALFVHVSTPGRGLVKLLVVPLALAAALTSPVLFATLMGYSVSWPLPERFTFIAYAPVVRAGVKTALEVWIREDGATRLHRAPYSKALEQMLQDAAKGAKGGREARITRKGRGQPGSETSEAPMQWELKFQSPSDVPKDGAGAAPPGDEPVTKRYSI